MFDYRENNKIVGGKETEPGEFPWMSLIFYDATNTSECAGSVIHYNTILTAAHCITGTILRVHGSP